MKKEKITAVILAGGQGKRMGSSVHKQYLLLQQKPLIYYALEVFQRSLVDDIVLVTGPGETDYCRKEIVERYGIDKVSAITEGGRERYHSVYEGLKRAKDCSYVLIHDGARPLVNTEIIEKAAAGAREFGACVVGMPVKDTIKVADEECFAEYTPDRRRLWQIQTPQAFSYNLVMEAYEKLFQDEEKQSGVTDDAMVVESMMKHKVKLVEGSYENIKVTTPEDMIVVESFLF